MAPHLAKRHESRILSSQNHPLRRGEMCDPVIAISGPRCEDSAVAELNEAVADVSFGGIAYLKNLLPCLRQFC